MVAWVFRFVRLIQSLQKRTNQTGWDHGVARGGRPRVGCLNPVGIRGRADLAKGIWESKAGTDSAAFVERYRWGTGCR